MISLDPAVYLPIAVEINQFTRANIISNNSGNSVGLAQIAAIESDSKFQKAELGGIWYLEPNWNPVGYQYPLSQWSNLSGTRNWFESLGLRLTNNNGTYPATGDVRYFMLEAI